VPERVEPRLEVAAHAVGVDELEDAPLGAQHREIGPTDRALAVAHRDRREQAPRLEARPARRRRTLRELTPWSLEPRAPARVHRRRIGEVPGEHGLEVGRVLAMQHAVTHSAEFCPCPGVDRGHAASQQTGTFSAGRRLEFGATRGPSP